MEGNDLSGIGVICQIGSYKVVRLVDTQKAEIHPGRLVLVIKLNFESEEGKKKARIAACRNLDEMTSSKTLSCPMLRMLLSLVSYQGWHIEIWDVSTAFLHVFALPLIVAEGAIWLWISFWCPPPHVFSWVDIVPEVARDCFPRIVFTHFVLVLL